MAKITYTLNYNNIKDINDIVLIFKAMNYTLTIDTEHPENPIVKELLDKELLK